MREKILFYQQIHEHAIDKADSTTSFTSEDFCPSVSLSNKKLKLLLIIMIVNRMKIILMSQDKC